MFKSKEGKLRKGVIASVVLSLAILAGGIQWFASTATPSMGNFRHEQMQQIGLGSTNGNTGNTTTASSNQGPPNGEDFHRGKFGDRDGKEGHGGSSNPFLVVLNYFAIWAAIIIPTYFLETRVLRKKRRSTNIQPT
ncbi:hypothetical protein AA0X95_03715 [Bacillus sp. 1P10SD]|uniref:hypothetical protein n=1 Tax=Bacillus sp. 1P10SD TaxID=3132265 RepID=UPI0039A70CA0